MPRSKKKTQNPAKSLRVAIAKKPRMPKIKSTNQQIAFKKAIEQTELKEIEKAAEGLSTAEILAVLRKRNALREDLAMSIVRNGNALILQDIVKALKKTIAIKNDKASAQQIWDAFEQRTRSLTGNKAAIRQRHTQKDTKPLTRIREKAALKIAQFWHQKRSSFKLISVNINGNHPDSFFAFLNNKAIKKPLSHFTDNRVLKALQNGNWQDPIFAEHFERAQASATNLFAANKITWQQHATVGDITQTAQVFGHHEAYPILTTDGKDFSPKAKEYLLQFLVHHINRHTEENFNDDELTLFKNLILCLPTSERFFFVFPEQRRLDYKEMPSPTNDIREDLKHPPYFRALKIPGGNDYQGVVKLSYGADNAHGLVSHLDDWAALLPRLGTQTIDDIEYYSSKGARPTESADSIRLGFIKNREKVHGKLCDFTEFFAHDHYHRTTMSLLGKEVSKAIARVIDITRKVFGFKWSKDLWLLTDANFVAKTVAKEIKGSAKYFNKSFFATKLFSDCLVQEYGIFAIESCDEDTRDDLYRSQMMFRNGSPRHMAQLLIIDLVMNAPLWREKYNIDVEHEFAFDRHYQPYIKIAKILKGKNIFGNDIKGNILKFDLVLKEINIYKFDAERVSTVLRKMKPQLQNIKPDDYEAKRDNKTVFLGFAKKSQPPVKKEETECQQQKRKLRTR
jgi:hypothetical protein